MKKGERPFPGTKNNFCCIFHLKFYFVLLHTHYTHRAARDPIRRIVQGFKNTLAFTMHIFSPTNIKHQLSIMQTMSIPDLIIGFFKAIFYVFYYSGYGVFGVIKYLLIDVLMSLMRGPAEEVHEEPSARGDQFMVNALTDSPSEDVSSSAAIADTSKDESGKMELVTQSSVAGAAGTGENAAEEGSAEQTEQQTGDSEPPMSLVSMQFSFFQRASFFIKFNII